MKFSVLSVKTAKGFSQALAILLYIAICTTALGSETYQTDHIPWSGHWWPTSKGGLATGIDYRGNPAPLQKYLMLQEGKTTGDAIDWYKERYYDPDAPYWYGLCGFWAKAAIYERIQFYPSTENNIVFRVGDKKGLVTLAHNGDISEQEDGSRPEIFHRWLLTYIKEQRIPFMFDRDPGEEGWSHPIYRYDMESVPFGTGESVTVTIYYVDDDVWPDVDFVGTRTRFKTYTYNLFSDVGSGMITGGEWTGNSIEDHPDLLTFPMIAMNNIPGFDYNEVLRIATSRDDELEAGEVPVLVGPGTYNLILMDTDIYRIDGVPGESISLDITKQKGSGESIDVVITDAEGAHVLDQTVELKQPLSLNFQVVNPPYSVTLSQEDYNDPNIYTIVLDQVKIYQQAVPYIPKNGYWSGFALTNTDDAPADNVTLTAYGTSGDPIQTLFGPATLAPGEKEVFLFENLPWRLYEYNALGQLMLSADHHIGQLNMIGSAVIEAAASQVQGPSMGSHLVLPETSSTSSASVTVFGSLNNPNFTGTDVALKLFRADGQLAKSTGITLAGKEKKIIAAGISPFAQMPNDGWIDIATEGGVEIAGYQSISVPGGIEGIFGIPVLSGEKYIPHVPPAEGKWKCWAVLINPNDVENTLRMHPMKAADTSEDVLLTLSPYEKRTVQLQPSFGKLQGDPLYQSIVKVTGALPYVGYYAYKPASLTDEAYFPFTNGDELKHEIVLHHNAGEGGYWWTAACLFNPGDSPMDVWVNPYGEDGDLQVEKVSKITLPAGGYEIVLSRHYFGINSAGEISYIKFTSAKEGDDFGGFVLYGTISYGMITGYNL